jgi:fructosamine-3-kinase
MRISKGSGEWIEMMWEAIEDDISRALNRPLRILERRQTTGGDINDAYHLRGEHESLFLKLNSAERAPMFAAEAAGLRAIRATDSVRVPEPLAHGSSGEYSWLALEYIEFGRGGPQTSARLGEQLAAMHRASAPAFGWEQDNTIGTTPQANPWTADWLEFQRRHRIGFQLELGRDNGLAAATLSRAAQLLEQLPALFVGYEPLPSLLHGDLWGGNQAASSTGEPVVFDPAVYFGDREADLAMTELFGGFDTQFYTAYRATWPLHPGYEKRRELYNLYHVLNHFNLFGGGYASRAAAIIDRLLRYTSGA